MQLNDRKTLSALFDLCPLSFICSSFNSFDALQSGVSHLHYTKLFGRYFRGAEQWTRLRFFVHKPHFPANLTDFEETPLGCPYTSILVPCTLESHILTKKIQ